jgi:hypothetical protein
MTSDPNPPTTEPGSSGAGTAPSPSPTSVGGKRSSYAERTSPARRSGRERVRAFYDRWNLTSTYALPSAAAIVVLSFLFRSPWYAWPSIAVYCVISLLACLMADQRIASARMDAARFREDATFWVANAAIEAGRRHQILTALQRLDPDLANRYRRMHDLDADRSTDDEPR